LEYIRSEEEEGKTIKQTQETHKQGIPETRIATDVLDTFEGLSEILCEMHKD
jgi:hypothetical protein